MKDSSLGFFLLPLTTGAKKIDTNKDRAIALSIDIPLSVRLPLFSSVLEISDEIFDSKSNEYICMVNRQPSNK